MKRKKRIDRQIVRPPKEDRPGPSAATDSAERQPTEEALRRSEARLRAILDAAVDGIITIDDRGLIESVNHAAEKLFGYAARELIGRNVSLLMPSPHREAHDSYLANYHYTGERKIIGISREVAGLRKDGSTFPLELAVSEVEFGGRRTFTGIVRDITERRRAEQRRQLQYAVARLLADARAREEVVPKLLQAIATGLDWEVGEFWEPDATAGKLRAVHHWHAPSRSLATFVKHSRARRFALFDGLPGRVLRRRRPDWIANLANDSQFVRRREAARAGLRSALAFPILAHDRVLGAMAFLSREVAAPDEDLLQALTALGSQIGLFMERIRLEENLRRSEANLAQAQAIAQVGSYEAEWPIEGPFRWSAEMFRILGLDPAAGALAPEVYLKRCVHPDDRARVQAATHKTHFKGEAYDLHYRIVRPDGAVRHVHSVAKPLCDATGKCVRIVGTLADITDRRLLEEEILGISDREQSRIAQDLHDNLCQHLAGIEFRLLGLKQKLAGESTAQAAETGELAKLVREAIEQTRTLARGLSPVMLEPEGLMNGLHELAVSTEHTYRISCLFNCPASVFIHNNAVATHLYRIAQEAIHNAIRHGKARFIVINLFTQNDRTVLGVKDDGLGFSTVPHNHKGMGLRVMQYRADMVGGSLVVQHDPDGGTSVICSLRAEPAPESGPTETKPQTGKPPATIRPAPARRVRRGKKRKDRARPC